MNEAKIAALPRGLKFVRWDHAAKPGSMELTVTKGDEVSIITLPKENDETGWYKVEKKPGDIGYIPKRCFYPRRKVNFSFTAQEIGELSVDVNEIIGVIKEDTEDDMWLVMKGNNETGKIPARCCYPSYKAHESHTASKREELSINKGDNIGIINKDRDDGYWMGYFRGETGLVPSKCFEPPMKVFWDYEAKQEGDLTVKEGDIVTIVDHEVTSTHGKIRVRLDDNIGYIPQGLFEIPIQVYKDHEQSRCDEISVTKGMMVGMVKENSEKGYYMVRQGDTTGLVPAECFEIPARVTANYESIELSAKRGDEVFVINPIANVEVRLGDKIGHIPLKCINIEVTEVAGKLEKKEHEENEGVAAKKRRLQSEKSISKSEKKRDVDNSALNYPLVSRDSEDVIDYIKDLKVGQIIDLGVSLGLSYETLTSIKCKDIHSGMVTAWLSKKDKVMETSGNPSWKSLKEALLKMGVTDVADMIMKDNARFVMAMMVNLQWCNDDNTMDGISILNEACNKWGTIATLLGINKAAVEEEYRTINDRFQKVLETWIETGGNNDYPATWMGLKKMLNVCKLGTCALKIKDAMKFLDI